LSSAILASDANFSLSTGLMQDNITNREYSPFGMGEIPFREISLA